MVVIRIKNSKNNIISTSLNDNDNDDDDKAHLKLFKLIDDDSNHLIGKKIELLTHKKQEPQKNILDEFTTYNISPKYKSSNFYKKKF